MYLDPDPRFWYEIKEKEIFEEFISLFRRICNSVQNIQDLDSASAEAEELTYLIKDIDLKSLFNEADKELDKFQKKINEQAMHHKVKVPVSHIIPAKGLSSNSINQILLTHGSNIQHRDSVPFGAFLDLQKMEPIH